MADITIRPIKALSDMVTAVELQKTYWGNDLESVIPAHMLFSLANHGGHVLAAFDGDKMVGVLVGFLGTGIEEIDRPAMANLQIFSKRMLVLPEYRSQGLGYRLKLAQRDRALAQGVRLVTWTYDPLLTPNAHLNVRKLGVTAQLYLENYYGTEGDSGLVSLGTSDRLVAEWWVTNRRVEERVNGTRPPLNLPQYLSAGTTLINPPTFTADGLMLPSEQIYAAATSLALLEIPTNFPAMTDDNPELALRWRLHTRNMFIRMFTSGYVVTDFLRDAYEGRQRAFYLLSYDGPQRGDSGPLN